MPFKLEPVTLVNFVGQPDKTSRLRIQLRNGSEIWAFPSFMHYPTASPWVVDVERTDFAPLLERYKQLNDDANRDPNYDPDRPVQLALYGFNRTDAELGIHKLAYWGPSPRLHTIKPEDVLDVTAVTIE